MKGSTTQAAVVALLALLPIQAEAVRAKTYFDGQAPAARSPRRWVRSSKLLHARMQIPDEARPNAVRRFSDLPQGKPAFYVMFEMPFPSAEAPHLAMNSREIQEVAADASRISTGGAPVMLAGA